MHTINTYHITGASNLSYKSKLQLLSGYAFTSHAFSKGSNPGRDEPKSLKQIMQQVWLSWVIRWIKLKNSPFSMAISGEYKSKFKVGNGDVFLGYIDRAKTIQNKQWENNDFPAISFLAYYSWEFLQSLA